MPQAGPALCLSRLLDRREPENGLQGAFPGPGAPHRQGLGRLRPLGIINYPRYEGHEKNNALPQRALRLRGVRRGIWISSPRPLRTLSALCGKAFCFIVKAPGLLNDDWRFIVDLVR